MTRGLNVGELIALLGQFDPALPVTGFNGVEETRQITAAGVRLIPANADEWSPTHGWRSNRAHVDIMGF